MSKLQIREARRFKEHINKLSVCDSPDTHDGFDAELMALRLVDQRIKSNLDEFYTGSLGSSMAKNRFDDVKPNEGTMVKLQPISKNGGGTYINANYVDCRDSFSVPFVYIATQAPLQNTVLDFWRMIYENDTYFIVMLCATSENGKTKSEQYWPDRGCVMDLGLMTIRTIAEVARPNALHSTFQMRTVRGDVREIYHMQFLGWPDGGIPASSAPLMEMIQAIAKRPQAVRSPIVVHCSGGVGRTGVFIALHIALAQFQLEQSDISVPKIVHFLKMCRSGMVQRRDQYVFLYYAILREMERMLLSAETGVNLLENRFHSDTARQQHGSPFKNSSQYSTGLLSSIIRPVPTSQQGNLRLMSGKQRARWRKGSAARETPVQHDGQQRFGARPPARDMASDRTIMAGYLQRRGIADHGRSSTEPANSSFSVSQLREEPQRSSPLFLNSSPLRSAVSSLSFASPSLAMQPTPADTLEGELAQLQSVNKMRRNSHVNPGFAAAVPMTPLALATPFPLAPQRQQQLNPYSLSTDEVRLL